MAVPPSRYGHHHHHKEQHHMLSDITNLPIRDDILIRERALELAIEHTSSTGGHPLSYADGFENYIRSGETPFRDKSAGVVTRKDGLNDTPAATAAPVDDQLL